MTDDQRRSAIENLTAGFDAEDDEAETRTLAEVIEEMGFTDAEILAELQRGENPFAKKADDKAKGKDGEKKPTADPKKPCNCDKVEGKHTVGDHKKTSSGGEGKKPPFEKKSEDGESEAPAVGSDDSEPRSEAPDDAAQAGTSKGMTSNARERALRLLDI